MSINGVVTMCTAEHSGLGAAGSGTRGGRARSEARTRAGQAGAPAPAGPRAGPPAAAPRLRRAAAPAAASRRLRADRRGERSRRAPAGVARRGPARATEIRPSQSPRRAPAISPVEHPRLRRPRARTLDDLRLTRATRRSRRGRHRGDTAPPPILTFRRCSAARRSGYDAVTERIRTALTRAERCRDRTVWASQGKGRPGRCAEAASGTVLLTATLERL